jgi:hypothetical protein
MQDSKSLDVNVKPHAEANGNGHTNGSSPIHLARNPHVTRCGLDRSFFNGAIGSSKISEVTSRNCRRAHTTLTLIRQRAHKWEQEHNHRPIHVVKSRPGLVQTRIAFERAEQNA